MCEQLCALVLGSIDNVALDQAGCQHMQKCEERPAEVWREAGARKQRERGKARGECEGERGQRERGWVACSLGRTGLIKAQRLHNLRRVEEHVFGGELLQDTQRVPLHQRMVLVPRQEQRQRRHRCDRRPVQQVLLTTRCRAQKTGRGEYGGKPAHNRIHTWVVPTLSSSMLRLRLSSVTRKGRARGRCTTAAGSSRTSALSSSLHTWPNVNTAGARARVWEGGRAH